MFHDTEKCPKFEEKQTLDSKNNRTLLNFNVSSGKSIKVCTLMYIKFQLKKYGRMISHDTEKRSKL